MEQEKRDRERRTGVRAAALRAAFPLTLPILAGFMFLGITCGIYAESLGLPWWVPTLMATAIFAGSAEFVVASMLTGAFDPVQTFITVFVINARHLFYGVTMLDRLPRRGRLRPYLIFGMCDETFSITCSHRAPEGVDEGWFMFFVALLNQLYWICGCTLGSIFGNLVAAEVAGVDFAMTALFVVIFLDQWLADRVHAGAAAGAVASIGALALFGPDSFIIPAMVAILVLLIAARPGVERRLGSDADGTASPKDGAPAPEGASVRGTAGSGEGDRP